MRAGSNKIDVRQIDRCDGSSLLKYLKIDWK